MIYAMTNKGIRTLHGANRIERVPTTDVNAQNRTLDNLFVRHALLVSHIHATFSLAASRAGYELVHWREGRELIDRVEVAMDAGYVSIPVAPDSFFALQEPKGRRNFFL